MVKYDLLTTYRIPAFSSRTPADGFVVAAHGETRKTATKKGAELMSRHGRGLRDKSRGGSIAQRWSAACGAHRQHRKTTCVPTTFRH